MAEILTENFLGYSSKSDRFTGDARIASDCENIIINQGDICNMPYPQEVIPHVYFNEKRIIFYNIRGAIYRVIFDSGESGQIEPFIHIKRLGLTRSDFFGFPSFFGYDRLNSELGGSGSTNIPVHGNLMVIGEWILFLAPGHRINKLEFSGFKNLGQMVRFKVESEGSPAGTSIMNVIHSPIGVSAPKKTSFVNITTASLHSGDTAVTWANSGIGDIGLTFITDLIKDETGFQPQASTVNLSVTSLNDLESNVTVADNEENYSATGPGLVPQFKVYIPDGYELTLESVRHKCGVYFKKENEAFYYFLGYTADLPPHKTQWSDPDGKYLLVSLDMNGPISDSNRILDRVAPLTGISGPVIGAHNVPRAAVHGAFYKGRMYYQSLSAESIDQSVPGNIKNRLEYSAITPIGEDETGRHAAYIEGEEFIGNAAKQGTGLIEFLGRLIIFKEDSTFILSDDIAESTATIRSLFRDKGCVNLRGGHAYIVVENSLYFLDHDGLYMFSGASNAPIRVSLPIQKDLESIDRERYRYARLSTDERYGLLYLSFPKIAVSEDIPTFIFHYKEGGVWTKTSKVDAPSEVVTNTRTNDVYLNRRSKLERLGNLEDSSLIAGENLPRWESKFIEVNSPGIRKHFKRLRIADSIPDNIQGVWNLQFFNGSLLLEDTLSRSKFFDMNLHTDKIRFTLQGLVPSALGQKTQSIRRGEVSVPAILLRVPFPHFRIRSFNFTTLIEGRI